MAVQSDTSSISYTGNNSTVTSYAVPFVFLENGHLQAIAKVTATGAETAVTLTNHTGAGDANGGTVRTAVAVPATSTLTIFRIVPATQTTSYQEGGDFPAASHERALDKLTFVAQQNERVAGRSLRVTEADGSRNDMVAVANSLVGLDGSKQPKALTASEVKTFLALTGVTLDVDAGIKTFLDAGERALAIPDFVGQLGSQRDTGVVYVSTGTAAGDWSVVSIENGTVDNDDIADDAITDAKVASNAAIAGSKISPDFGTQDVTGGKFFPTGTSATGTGIYVDSVNALIIGTNGNPRIRVPQSGLVGIGTALDSVSAQLHVKAGLNNIVRFEQDGQHLRVQRVNSRMEVSSTEDLALRTNIDSTAATPVIFSGTDSRFNGKIGIGLGGNAPDTALHVSGTIRYVSRPNAGTITAIGFDTNGDLKASSSSLRYKNNVENYTKGLDEVAQLRPVTFNYNGEQILNAGLIVEEVAQLGLEEFVLRDGQGNADAIPYANMVALLINAIKELKARVEELESQ
jgi:hypothetical protein